ncbi:MAG: ArdC-like ssDNA-binding domain-containing protein [Thomasclavelia ramosa]
MTSKYKASPEQLKKAKEKLNKTLQDSEHVISDLIENYETSPEALYELLAFSSKFYKYSLKNTALILKQNPNASFCASFKDWKDKKASIIKGSKGLTVLVPKTVKYILDSENGVYIKWSEAPDNIKEQAKNGKLKVSEKLVYGTGTVFDISQTDYPKEKYPYLLSVGYKSEEHGKLADILADYCRTLGCAVHFEHIDSITLGGFYDYKKDAITVNTLLDDTVKLSTLSHEFGHMISNHNNTDGKSALQKELEADVISIMFHKNYGLEIPVRRKEHFKDVFNALTEEIKETAGIEKKKENTDIKSAVNRKIETVISGAFDNYKKHASALDKLNHEKLLEVQPEKIEDEKDYEIEMQ